MKKLILNDDAIYRKEKDSYIAYNPLNLQLQIFNKTSADILEMCKFVISQDEVILGMKKLYSHEVDDDTLTQDVVEFINDMVKKGWIKEVDNGIKRKTSAKIFFENVNFTLDNSLHMPLVSFLEITKGCNLRCRHCHIEGGKRYKQECSTAEWMRVIDALWENGVFVLVFSGGEPFYRKDAIELLQYADNKGFLISIASNGLLLNDDLIDQLSNLKHLTSIAISLDGATPETHEFIRGKRTYVKTIDVIKKLNDRRFPIEIDTIIYKDNLSELEDFVKLLDRMGIHTFGFGKLISRGRGKKISDMRLSNEEFINFTKRLDEISKNPQISVHVSNEFLDTVKYITTPEISNSRTQKKSKNKPYACGMAYSQIVIDPEGNVFPCLYFRGRKYWLGNIINQSLFDIWHHSKNLTILRSYSANDYEQCRGCNLANECKGGCRLDAYDSSGSFFGYLPSCPKLVAKHLKPT
jgi:radical SAM protein with 4Fe4S-binding SPASM domain